MSPPGFEPGTPGLKVQCSTNWAMSPHWINCKSTLDYFWNPAGLAGFEPAWCRDQNPVPYRLAIAQEIKKGWVQGFEPWTFRATIWRADQLCYTHHNAKVISYWPWLIKKSVPGGIRTLDPRLRRPLLYPAELRTHKAGDGNRTHVSSLEG